MRRLREPKKPRKKFSFEELSLVEQVACVFGFGVLGLVAGGAVLISQAISPLLGKSNEDEYDGVLISKKDADVAKVKFPPGHPRSMGGYVGHPLLPKVYYTPAEFHRRLFEHKLSEAVELLMCLKAKTLRVQHVCGWSKEFASRIRVSSLEVPTASLDANVGIKTISTSEILFQATLNSSGEPYVPTNLVWYEHEQTWQLVANGRIKHGLGDFSLILSYEDDYTINARFKARMAGTAFDSGGTFEDFQTTVWKIAGTF